MTSSPGRDNPRAANGAGDGGAADSPPGPPTLRRSTRGCHCIVFRWDPPSRDGGEGIVGYELQTSADGATGWTSRPGLLPAATGWFLEGGLKPGSVRYYRLRAVGAAGPGPWSAVLQDATPIVGGPDMTATANGTGGIDLSWEEPASSADSDAHAMPHITGYRLQVSDSDSTVWRDLGGTLGRGARSYSHSGVQAGTRKLYRIRAVTAGAVGGWSTIVSAVAERVAGPDGTDDEDGADGPP